MIIGITGGSGSGKTTLLQLVLQLGGTVLDCDAIYHRLLQESPALLAAIGSRFPGTVTPRGLDRKALGAIVFSDEEALQDLNAITHRAVREQVQLQLAQAPKLAAIDAIALFEGGLAPLCDVTVAVTAPRQARIRRLMARDGITEEYARLRLQAQKSDEWFRQQCDFTLENDTTHEAFAAKCLAFFRHLGIME